MLYIKNETDEPYYNLALEEYLLKNMAIDEVCLMLWQNKPSVVIGRFQNAVDEVNVDYLQKKGLSVVRRISGGGTVYNDYGTLNYSFIEPNPSGNIDFHKFTGYIVNALNSLGVPAELVGRNNIEAGNQKIGWSAYYHNNRKTLHHGVLSYNTNFDNMRQALSVKANKLMPSANIVNFLDVEMSLEKFKTALLNALFHNETVREYELTEKELSKVKEFTAEKYLTWLWNYGNSPVYNIKKAGRFSSGNIELCLCVEKGIINSCKVYGDFIGNEEMADFEARLIGIKYEKKAVGKAIGSSNIRRFFGELKEDELTGLFF